MESPGISVPLAMAVRRAALGAGVLAAALAAHLVAEPDAHATDGAPVLWVGLVALCALVGPRRGWQRRGVARTAVLAGGLQVAAHAAMSAAPWAFGLSAHHPASMLIEPRAIVPHLAAALFLAVALALFETALGTARRIVGALVRRLRASRGGPGRAPRRRLPPPGRVPRGLGSRIFASRGPPPVHV